MSDAEVMGLQGGTEFVLKLDAEDHEALRDIVRAEKLRRPDVIRRLIRAEARRLKIVAETPTTETQLHAVNG